MPVDAYRTDVVELFTGIAKRNVNGRWEMLDAGREVHDVLVLEGLDDRKIENILVMLGLMRLQTCMFCKKEVYRDIEVLTRCCNTCWTDIYD